MSTGRFPMRQGTKRHKPMGHITKSKCLQMLHGEQPPTALPGRLGAHVQGQSAPAAPGISLRPSRRKSGNLPRAKRAPGCPPGAPNAVVLPKPGSMRAAKASKEHPTQCHYTAAMSTIKVRGSPVRPGEINESRSSWHSVQERLLTLHSGSSQGTQGRLASPAQAQRHCTQVISRPFADCDPIFRM